MLKTKKKIRKVNAINAHIKKFDLEVDIIFKKNKGILFWGTAIQRICLKLIFSTIPLNHLRNGVQPNFTKVAKKRLIKYYPFIQREN